MCRDQKLAIISIRIGLENPTLFDHLKCQIKNKHLDARYIKLVLPVAGGCEVAPAPAEGERPQLSR